MYQDYATINKATKKIVRIYDEKDVAEHTTASMGNNFEVVVLERKGFARSGR